MEYGILREALERVDCMVDCLNVPSVGGRAMQEDMEPES